MANLGPISTVMGLLIYLLFRWGFFGIILQGLAIVHFIRRRPDNYWIFIILFSARSAQLFICWWRRFLISGWWASRSKFFRGASA
jgi:hypothetical protein